jgi:hypothetical protein
MLVFNKYFYKNKKSKLYVGDRVAVLNDFIYQTGGSTLCLELTQSIEVAWRLCNPKHRSCLETVQNMHMSTTKTLLLAVNLVGTVKP